MSILTPTPEWLEEEAHNPEKSAEDLLRRLGFSGKLRGFRYLTSAIAQTVVDPDRIFLITKVLYAVGRYYPHTVLLQRRLPALDLLIHKQNYSPGPASPPPLTRSEHCAHCYP